MKKIILLHSIIFLFSALSYSQENSRDTLKYKGQTTDILMRLDRSFLGYEIGDDALIAFLTKDLRNEGIYVIKNDLSKDPETLVPPSINDISRVMNATLNKFVDSLFYKSEHDYAVIPLSRLKWIKTYTDCFFSLDSNVLEVEIGLRINDLLKKELEEEQIISSTDKIGSSTLLTDLFVSGFSLNPGLNKILDKISKEFKRKIETISLLEASNLTTIKECSDLLKEKAKLPGSSSLNPYTKWVLKNIPNYFSTAKSSDEMIKPRSSRSPVSYSYSNSPASRQFDAYYGFNLVGFLNNYESISMFLGPVGETHLYSLSDKDSVNTESWGLAFALTELLPTFGNLRLKEFGAYYFRRNDYKKGIRGTEFKGSLTFSFETRNWSRFLLPSYEPIGYRQKFLTNKVIEIFSYMWSPSFNYDLIKQESSDSGKLGPISMTLNANIFLLQRVVELDGSWKYKLYVNSTAAPQFKDFNMYREFGIKLNIVDIKSTMLKPIVKDFKLSFGFDYQDGINLSTGTNQVIRSLVFGFGF